MESKKIELVGRVVAKDAADEDDFNFWLNKTVEERLAETERLRRMIWTFRLGKYPDKIEKVGKTYNINSISDGDDF
ncbi:MAG TPA: hypothetical protein VHZ50_15155 [Puia sp.]|nr:hypothetical protein [Puia sp.]